MAGGRRGSREGEEALSLVHHILFFLLISLVSAIAIAAIRLRDGRQIVREATHFFVAISVGVGVFCVLICLLEWIFVRPLV